MIKLTTSTGSYYHLTDDFSRWRKNGGEWHMTYEFGAVPPWEQDRSVVMTEGLIAYSQERGDLGRLPKVGECLYVNHRDVWWLSTPITSIEEV